MMKNKFNGRYFVKYAAVSFLGAGMTYRLPGLDDEGNEEAVRISEY